MSTKRVFCLYGVAKRDPKELVCMFFAKRKDVEEFKQGLPGRYRVLKVKGVSYDQIHVEPA